MVRKHAYIAAHDKPKNAATHLDSSSICLLHNCKAAGRQRTLLLGHGCRLLHSAQGWGVEQLVVAQALLP